MILVKHYNLTDFLLNIKIFNKKMNQEQLKELIINKFTENDEKFLMLFINKYIINIKNNDFNLVINTNVCVDYKFHYWMYDKIIKNDKTELLKLCNDKIKIIFLHLLHYAARYDSVECYKYLFNIHLLSLAQIENVYRSDNQFIIDLFMNDSIKCYEYLETKISYKDNFVYLKMSLDKYYFPNKILKYIAKKEKNLSEEIIVLISMYYTRINLDDKEWRDILFNSEFKVSKQYEGIVDRLKTIVSYKKNMVTEVRNEVRKTIMSISTNDWYYVIPKDVLEVCLLEYI